MTLFFIFLIGLFVGSFLGVLADRLPRGETVLKGRSHCEKCRKTLKWYDLIPLLSFIFLRGKCRYCHTRLSLYYPIVELITGIIFAGVFLFLEGTDINFITAINIIILMYWLFIVSSLIVVFFADLKYGIIPDKIVFPAIFVSVLFFVFGSFTSKESWFLFVQPATFEVGNRLLSAIGACLFFMALFLITKGRGMGFGDVKFAFLMGLILGFPNIIISLYIAFLTGAIVGIILILWKKKKVRGTAIPFGPFLVLGTLAGLFWGEIIFQKAGSALGLL